jgi:predicted nuclease of restriction endonuclease-like (RecB) superfamily
MKRKSPRTEDATTIYERIREILQSAKVTVSRSVNTTQVVANWLIGREIVEEEQRGKRRAEYGEKLLAVLSELLKAEFGAGYSVPNLRNMRQFYQVFPVLLNASEIRYALRSESKGKLDSPSCDANRNPSTLGGGVSGKSEAPPPAVLEICYALRSESTKRGVPVCNADADANRSWQPGRLHPNLSWTHYRTLLRVDNADARAFYEIEAIENRWSARELERQINSLLYERLALSKDKKGLMRLATKGQEIQQPTDIFKDPVVIEFLGLPESPRLVETDLEQKLIDNLQTFLLELGKGFAFVKRQERLTLEGDHFYVDLVFYHTILKCYVLIDLNTGKLTHEDLGQLQLYVNYYDRERRTEGDQPTLGLILCTDKNDTVVKYTLGPDQQNKIFASRYKLHLPTEKELQDEIRREVRFLTAGESKRPHRKAKR